MRRRERIEDPEDTDEMCLIMLMINSSPVQLEAKVGELELEPVEEAPLYRLEELRERLGDVQIWLTKVQDRVEDVSQRLVKIQTIYANEVWLKYSYDTSEEWSRVTLLKGRKKTQPTVDLCLPEKYPNGHAVKTKKIEDLVKMIPYIPTEHRHFYEALQEHVTVENVSDDEYGQ